jgi:NitT/TauT family transport system substrate-binding protein
MSITKARRSISRRSFLAASSLSAGLLPFAASGQSSKPTSVKISYFPSFTSLPIMVAIRHGFFSKHDIDPHLVQISSGGAIQAALVSRSVDFVINPPQLHLQTVEKGQDVRMFLNNFNAPIWSIVFTNKMAAPNLRKGYPAMLADLKGMKVGVTGRGSVQELLWRYMLQDAGLDPDRDVSFISVGTVNTAIPALQQNLVQAYFASEPMQSMIAEGGYAHVVLDLWKGQGPEVLRKDWITNCWATRGDLIRSSPDTVRRFAAAIREAHVFMHRPENLEKVLVVAEEIAPTAKQLLRSALPGVLAVMGAELPRSSIQAANRFLVENKLLKEAIPLERAMWEA